MFIKSLTINILCALTLSFSNVPYVIAQGPLYFWIITYVPEEILKDISENRSLATRVARKLLIEKLMPEIVKANPNLNENEIKLVYGIAYNIVMVTLRQIMIDLYWKD